MKNVMHEETIRKMELINEWLKVKTVSPFTVRTKEEVEMIKEVYDLFKKNNEVEGNE